ncbi:MULTISPECIES: phosphodiester glycosidase family protein [Vibrio]|uniref:phosphodiester glycosidase family protein n=1 Tax=Vibrio TaxID=662 RepID=UPI002075935D|nr:MULTISPECIES: phosphodiester glycosidase family protein [Vibrio]USD33539.1 phosphodiester glycosidase family protein [Vibrio sp. SCSIO 43186]USD46607.1 phosphodiester glycosidase family protein [Vibrio sp. SCSIO 43145]USD70663.1 phosphodiester glycosidase family protein [Vibrio sp. SCSIO 43139]USD95582.1 metallophosphoesterase [Vibrio coralliilyticus]
MKIKFKYSSVAVMLMLALSGCDDSSDNDTVNGDNNFGVNIITPPDDIEEQFLPIDPPVVDGTTGAEPDSTEISDYNEYQINSDLKLTRGELNHTKGSSIMSMEFLTGNGLDLLPLERSTGQFTMESTTESANSELEKGINVIGAVNGDFFDIYDGWNLGIFTRDGVNYTGWDTNSEAAIVIKHDGQVDIVESSPYFELVWALNGGEFERVKGVHYFDKAEHISKIYTSETPDKGSISIYPGDSYRGTVDLSSMTGALVKPEVNGITVVANSDDSAQVQFAPLAGEITEIIQGDSSYVIPSGYALVAYDAGKTDLAIGDKFEAKFITEDSDWADVKHAIGAGNHAHLLVKEGELSDGAIDDPSDINSRTAFGIKADGSSFFLTVDKPVGSNGDGISLKKLGQIMLGYGAVKAVNLDGGGSTTMVAKMPGQKQNHVINVPADGSEREVANKLALTLDKDQATYPDDVAIYPKTMTILAGAEYESFMAIGYDGSTLAGNEVDKEFGISSIDIGRINIDSGAFKASDKAAEGYVGVNVGELQGFAQVEVVDSVDSLIFDLEEVTVDAGGEVTLLPTLIANDEQVTYTPDQLEYQLSSDEFGYIDPETGVFHAKDVQGAEVEATVKYQDQQASVLIKIGVPPEVVDDFESGVDTYVASGSRHLEVNIEPESENVFDGSSALKLSWITDPAQPGTFGAYVVDDLQRELSGYPQAFGVNVYIPEELAGKEWWVRGKLVDKNGSDVAIDYNNEGDSLPEKGWHFMQAPVPEGFTPPFKMSEPFRFLVLETANRIDSHVILDNFTTIYSSDTDLNGPSVTVTPADQETVDSQDVSIRLQLFDDSEVDFERTELILDGEDVSGSLQSNGIDAVWFDASGLSDGWHKVEYRAYDKNGNVSAGDTLFNVVTDQSRVYVESEHELIYPSGTFDFPVKVTKGEDLGTFVLELTYDATKSQLIVQAEDIVPTDVETDVGYWKGTFTGMDENSETLARVELMVNDYVQNSAISLGIGGTLDGETYYHPMIKQDVGGKYMLITDHTIQGQTKWLLVTDAQGKPAPGVEVETFLYNSENDEVSFPRWLGTTDHTGRVEFDEIDAGPSREVYFRAYDDEGASLMSTLMSLDEQLTDVPSQVFITPGRDVSEVNVTWFTESTVEDTVAFYGTDGLNQTASVTSSEILPFFYGEEAGVVRVHHALLSGLKPGTEYQYRVGHQGKLSETYRFTTDDQDDDVRIMLYGDTQTTGDGSINHGAPLVTELFDKMESQLPDTDLIMHVGDFTEDMSDYQLVRQFFDAISGEGRLASKLFVPTVGNHEVYNEGREKFEAIFNTPQNGPFGYPNQKSIYSFDYGNAHIAVLNTELFTDEEWIDMTDWLVNDMQASDKPWKLVMLHRPPYNANPNSGNDMVNQYLPQAADTAGVDLVLSGHDHIYSRSVAVEGGKPNAAGVNYLIAGSASMKFYDAGQDGIVPIADVLYDDDVHTFTTLHIQGEELTIESRNINGVLIDSKVLTNN